MEKQSIVINRLSKSESRLSKRIILIWQLPCVTSLNYVGNKVNIFKQSLFTRGLLKSNRQALEKAIQR